MAAPPPADRVIQLLWSRSASFSRALRSLAQLELDQLEQLHLATVAGFESESVDLRPIGVPPDVEEDILRVLKSLYSMRALERTPEELADDIVGLVSGPEGGLSAEEANARRSMFEKLLQGRPDMDLENRRTEVEQSFLPMLFEAQMALDLRASKPDGGSVQFVPVVVVRLDFDEPVAAGDHAIFQLSLEGLEALKQAVAEAESLLAAVQDERAEMLL